MKRFLWIFMCSSAFIAVGQNEGEDVLEPFLEPSLHLEKFVDVDKMREEDEAAANWDEDYRTSDEVEERSTQFSFDVNHPPEGAERVGCECMDGTTMDLKGGGACAGYGGVRYWIYEDEAGTRSMYPTQRHHEHPTPLTEEELSSLTSYGKQIKYGDSYDSPVDFRLGWLELLAIIIVCVTIAFITKTLWGVGNRNGRRNHDER